MHCIIVDDEPDAISVLETYVQDVPFLKLSGTFREPLVALEFLKRSPEVDLVFLDINMPKLSGIQFTKLLENKPQIIYTTAYSEYALESYEYSAVDYLLKPIEFERFLQAVMKVERQSDNAESENEKSKAASESIFVKSSTDYHQLKLSEIQYLESEGNYVTYYTEERKVVVRQRLIDAIAGLNSDMFVQVHRSFVVSKMHVKLIKSYAVQVGNKEVPIGKKYREGMPGKLMA